MGLLECWGSRGQGGVAQHASGLTHRRSTFGFGRDGAQESNVVIEVADCAGVKVWSCTQTDRLARQLAAG